MDRAVMLYAQQAIYHDLVQHANQASQRRISITLGANRLPVNQIGESQSPLAELQIEMNTEIVPCHSNHPAAKQACSMRRPALFGFFTCNDRIMLGAGGVPAVEL